MKQQGIAFRLTFEEAKNILAVFPASDNDEIRSATKRLGPTLYMALKRAGIIHTDGRAYPNVEILPNVIWMIEEQINSRIRNRATSISRSHPKISWRTRLTGRVKAAEAKAFRLDLISKMRRFRARNV